MTCFSIAIPLGFVSGPHTAVAVPKISGAGTCTEPGDCWFGSRRNCAGGQWELVVATGVIRKIIIVHKKALFY